MARLAFLVVLALILAACATPAVYTDHDPGVNFSQYQTYYWRQKPESAPPLINQRIVAGIDAQLQAKGWRPAPAETADVVLAAHVASHREYTIDSFYDGPMWGGWGWDRYWGMSAGYRHARVRSYTVGTLVLDMFDARSKQAIWSGSAEGTVPRSPQKVNEHIDLAIGKMFAGFPPGSVPVR